LKDRNEEVNACDDIELRGHVSEQLGTEKEYKARQERVLFTPGIFRVSWRIWILEKIIWI
jgi:hypothetical protein